MYTIRQKTTNKRKPYVFVGWFLCVAVICTTLPSLAMEDDDDVMDLLAGVIGAINNFNSPLGHLAFEDFGANVTIVLDGDDVILEGSGKPDHTSTYWNPNSPTGLYVDPDPAITNVFAKSPGDIDDYNNTYTLRISNDPQLAATSSPTTLGAIGIAVSGAPIFNDEEGPGVALAMGVINGFDRNGAHTGPETYHYHLEPKAISDDDEELVGIISDGFFLYGRRCNSINGGYPNDLDASGGHVSRTQHTRDAEYHYHIMNELYLGAYYLNFPGNYQGTPVRIN